MNKKTTTIIAIIIIVLLLILTLLFFILRPDKTYTIEFNTDGGSEITTIEVKQGETFKLPDAPTKEGYIFAGWANEKGEIIASDITLDKSITLKSLWIEEDKETNTISFYTDNESSYNDIIIEKGKYIILPIAPEKEGFIFVGWINDEGNIITNTYIVNGNIKLYAKWISKEADIITINFNADDGNKIDKIIVEKGKIVSFPISPIKEGYVFDGWVNDKGEEVDVNTTFSDNITLKATWKELYTCPSDCKVSDDFKTCVKTETTNITTTSNCPNGTETVEYFCNYRATGDGWSSPAINCSESGQRTGFCVQYSSISYRTFDWNTMTCPSGYFRFSYADHGGAEIGCIKKFNKEEVGGCPNGYTKNGDGCTKTTIINCTLNVAKEYKHSNNS